MFLIIDKETGRYEFYEEDPARCGYKGEFEAENAKLKWKIVAERITGDTAEVDVDITDSDAKTQKGTLKLVKEGGAWKICGGESRK